MTFKRFDPNTPLVVSGVIRLADKYGIESLREHLIKVVVSDWPTTLQEWVLFQIEIKGVKEKLDAINDGLKPRSNPSYLRDHIPEPASAIAFAQEFGCRQILPAAFYQLSTIEPYHDWDHNGNTWEPRARWELLSKDDLLRYIRGSNRLLARHPSEVDFLSSNCFPPHLAGVYEEVYDRVVKSACAIFFRHLLGNVWDFRTRSTRDPLHLLSRCLEYYDSDTGRERVPGMLCIYCEGAFRNQIPELRSKIWAELPRCFNLDELP